MKDDGLLSLVGNLVMLSLIAIGGANAVLPDLHRLAVQVHGWTTEAEFSQLYALSSAAPGPNVLIVALLGLKLGGIGGAVAALVAMCGPAGLLSFAIGRTWNRIKDKPWRIRVQRGLAPLTVGLIAATGLLLAEGAATSWVPAALTAATVGFTLVSTRNPLWMLAAAAGLGLCGIG